MGKRKGLEGQDHARVRIEGANSIRGSFKGLGHRTGRIWGKGLIWAIMKDLRNRSEKHPR
jgi:hypothetical protein